MPLKLPSIRRRRSKNKRKAMQTLILVKLLAWILLMMAVLSTISVYLEIRVKRDPYRILEKVSLFSLAILGVLIGIIGLLAK